MFLRTIFFLEQVFSKGSLITQGRFRMRNRKQQDQNLRITYAIIPQAKLLIYYVRRNNGEVVADAISFPIEDIFDNAVSICKTHIDTRSYNYVPISRYIVKIIMIISEGHQ